MADLPVEIEVKKEPAPATTDVVIDKVATRKSEPKIVTADEGVEELKAQVERARAESQRRLQEADRRIAEAQRRAVEAERETATVKTGAVSTVIDSLAKDKDAARRDYKTAMEAGDYEKAAEAQDRMSLANARLVEAERGKVELEAQAKNPSQGRQIVEPVNDPLEDMVRAIGPNTRSGQWLRAHPDYARDAAKNDAMTRAHFAAMGEGISVESDDYFRFVEKRLGIGGRDQQQDLEYARSPTAAPVSRDVAQSPGVQRPGTVRLTASEVSTAKALDMTLEDYARYKKQLTDEGKIGRMAS